MQATTTTITTTCARRPPIRNVPLSISGLVAGAAAAVAGVILGQLSSATAAPPQQSCEACGGDGYIDCFCSKWSYQTTSSRDTPPPRCDTCRGSKRQRCPRCRGGGTKIPLLRSAPIPVRIKEPLEDILSRSVLMPMLLALPFVKKSPCMRKIATPVAFNRRQGRIRYSRYRECEHEENIRYS